MSVFFPAIGFYFGSLSFFSCLFNCPALFFSLMCSIGPTVATGEGGKLGDKATDLPYNYRM